MHNGELAKKYQNLQHEKNVQQN